MSGVIVEKKNGKTIITVVQDEESPGEERPERGRDAVSPSFRRETGDRRTFLHEVLGRRLVFHLTTGEEVEGILDGFDRESLRIEDAFLYNEAKEIRCDWMILERRQLVSVYPPARSRTIRRSE